MSLPEGTARNTQIQDFIPSGISFLNDGTARYAFVSSSGNSIASATVASIPVPALAAAGISGDQTTIGSITSASITGLFADANISTTANGAGTGEGTIYADGASVFFRFGTLTNTDNDVDVEYIVVEFNALVLNVNANQSGSTLTNQLGVLVDTDNNGTAGYISIVNDINGDGSVPVSRRLWRMIPVTTLPEPAAIAGGPTVTVVEPVIVDVVKASNPSSGVDAGDTINYTVTFRQHRECDGV